MSALPIIDLHALNNTQALAKELLRVGKNPGFFYLVGHNITLDLFDLCHVFFTETSFADKRKFSSSKGGEGYTGMRDENLAGKGRGDLKESLYIAPHTPDRQLPDNLEVEKDKIDRFITQCEEVSQKLLQCFALGLGLPENYLSKHHSGTCNRLRLIHYPKVPYVPNSYSDENEDIRAGAHSDYGSLTLLFQQPTDAGGLQVLSNDTTWTDVPYLNGAIVVNIGDALEFWTGGILRSTVHRVVFPRSEQESASRFSIPFFVQPNDDVLLEPLSLGVMGKDRFGDVLKEKGYVSGEAVTAGEHLRMRLAATYQ